MNNLYETIIIFNPNTDYKSSVNKISTFCQNATGDEYEIDTEDIGCKNLAYKIKDQKKGYYYLLTWLGNKDDIIELESMLQNDDTVLKFITIKKEDEGDFTLKPKPKEPVIVDLLDIIYNL